MRRRCSRFVVVLLAGLSLVASVLAIPAAAAAPNLELTPGYTTMEVTWDDGSPVDQNGSGGFAISISPDPGGGASPVDKQASDRSHTFSGLEPGTEYTVELTDKRAGTAESASASATTKTPAAPDAPTSVTIVKKGTTGATVSWTPGATNGSTVSDYTVSLIATNGGVAPDAQPVSATTVDFDDLAPGTYSASVVANGSAGSSSAGLSAGSNAGTITISAPVEVPAPPTGVNATADGGTITVTFSSTVDGGSDDATSYRIRLLNPDGTEATRAQPSNAQVGISTSDNSGSFELSTTISGEYGVDVAATNEAGTSSPVPAPDDVTVSISPTVPRSVTSSSDGDRVTVNWTVPSTTGGEIDHYLVTVGPDTVTVDAPASEVVVSGVAQGTYTPSVVAVNKANLDSSAGSGNTVTVVVPADAPLDVNVTATVRTVVVTWGAPANSGGSPVLSYEVTVDGVSKTVGGTTTSVTFTNVSLGSHVAVVVATTSVGAGAEASSPEFEVKRSFHPFDSDEGFVNQLYRDILGRNADAGGRSYWASIVADNTANVPTVVKSFLSSPEFGPREPIIRLYLAYFNRAPDAGGFDYWTDLYVDGEINLAATSYYFSTSEEFNATYGSLSDGQFVVLVYNNVLGRSPDVGGYNHWVNLLSRGLSRSQLMIEFSESPEFLASSRNFVDITMVYRGMLARIPSIHATTNEFNIWLPRLGRSEDIDDLIMDVFSSDEYAARVTP